MKSFACFNPFSSTDEKITIQSILANDRCRPLSRDDFTSYVTYAEHSEENLLFFCWFNLYAARYRKLQAEELLDQAVSPSSQSIDYTFGLARHTDRRHPDEQDTSKREVIQLVSFLDSEGGLQPFREHVNHVITLFFQPRAPFELNLPAKMRNAVCRNAQFSTDPIVFQEAAEECLNTMKYGSLPRFLELAKGNINRPKQMFWYSSGAALTMLSWLLYLAPIVCELSRAYRLIGVPFSWLGAAQIYSASQNICFQVYSRRVRQIFSWDAGTVRAGNVFMNDERLNMEDIIHELSMAERARKPMAQLGRVFEDEFPIVDKYVLNVGTDLLTLLRSLNRQHQRKLFYRVILVATFFSLAILGVFMSVPEYLKY